MEVVLRMRLLGSAFLATLCLPVIAVAQEAQPPAAAPEAAPAATPAAPEQKETAYTFSAAGEAKFTLFNSQNQLGPTFDPRDNGDMSLTWKVSIPRGNLTLGIAGKFYHEDMQGDDDVSADPVDMKNADAGWFMQEFAENIRPSAEYKAGMFTGHIDSNLTDENPDHVYLDIAPVEGLTLRLGRWEEGSFQKLDLDESDFGAEMIDGDNDEAIAWTTPDVLGLRAAYEVKGDAFKVTPWFAYVNSLDDAGVITAKKSILVGAEAEVAGFTPSFAFGMGDVVGATTAGTPPVTTFNLRPVTVINVGLGYKMDGLKAKVAFLTESWGKTKAGVTNENGKISSGTDADSTEQSVQNIDVTVDGDSSLFGLTDIQTQGDKLIFGVGFNMNKVDGKYFDVAANTPKKDADTLNIITAYGGYSFDAFSAKLGFEMDGSKAEVFSNNKGTEGKKNATKVYLSTGFEI